MGGQYYNLGMYTQSLGGQTQLDLPLGLDIMSRAPVGLLRWCSAPRNSTGVQTRPKRKVKGTAVSRSFVPELHLF